MTRHPGEQGEVAPPTWIDWLAVAVTICVAVPVGMLLEHRARKRRWWRR
jgi:hypothetical protein